MREGLSRQGVCLLQAPCHSRSNRNTNGLLWQKILQRRGAIQIWRGKRIDLETGHGKASSGSGQQDRRKFLSIGYYGISSLANRPLSASDLFTGKKSS